MKNVIILLLLLLVPSCLYAQIEFIIQYDDGNSAYYSGRPEPGDTCGVWFEPPTECQILGGQFQFNDGMGGDALVYVWDIVDDFDPGNYYDSNEIPASAGPTPLGEILAGAIPIGFTGGDWEEIVFADYGYAPEDLDVGMDLFYIGYKLEGTGAEPYYPSIMGDAEDERPYHSIAWLTDPGGMYAGESGWWAYGIDWMIRARVNLYGDPMPSIQDLADPPDTYLSGPYTITATITDNGIGGAPGVVQYANLIYSVDNGMEYTVPMINTAGDIYQADIPAVALNQKINFRIEAEDDQGGLAVEPGLAGYYFSYLQPSGAPILLVNDTAQQDGGDLFIDILESNGFGFDTWFIGPGMDDDMGYPGDDVINTDLYRTVIWFNRSGYSGTLPDNDADLTIDPVANFMDAGGNFFLASSDYIGGAFVPNVWTEFYTIPGTFMYEYLMILDGWSDAHIDPSTGESLDTLHIGVEDDPISGDFYPDGLYSHPSPNFNDYCFPRSPAATCFRTEIDHESAGIRYDGAFKMVFIPWTLQAADDPNDVETVILNVLNYFQEDPGPDVTLLEGSRYSIYGDTPYPVTVEATDPLGVAGVVLKYAWDGGEWQESEMELVGDDQYCASFDIPAYWDDMEYYVLATNSSGGFGATDTYACHHSGLSYNSYAGWLFCSDLPYQQYTGHPDYGQILIDILDTHPEVQYDVWDVDEYGTPDYWTVLENYEHCIWVGYCDWEASFPMQSADNPFTPFLENGGNLLFSSEEMMGVWTGWVNHTFVPGEFAYDWLSTEEVLHDCCYETVQTGSSPDILCQGMSSEITLVDLYYTSFSDWVTPTYSSYIEVFYGYLAGFGSWYCGLRNPTGDYNAVHLSFCLYQLPQTELEQFTSNVIDFFRESQGSVSAELIPTNPPIQIPATGGTFEFDGIAVDNLSTTVTADLWTMVVYPDGTVEGPLMGPALDVELSPGMNDWHRYQNVAGDAPPGQYTYIGYAGDYPDDPWASDAFTFEKLETGNGPWIDNWDNWGDPIGNEGKGDRVLLPEQFALHAAYPNPFNPATALRYDLPEAAKVTLQVFNIQGQLVSTLVDGHREAGYHEAVFRADHLASGLYIYRFKAGDYRATGKMMLIK